MKFVLVYKRDGDFREKEFDSYVDMMEWYEVFRSILVGPRNIHKFIECECGMRYELL